MSAPGAELDDITTSFKNVYHRAADAARRAAADRGVRARTLAARGSSGSTHPGTHRSVGPRQNPAETGRSLDIARAAAHAGAASVAAQQARDWAESARGEEKDAALATADAADAQHQAWNERLREFGVDVDAIGRRGEDTPRGDLTGADYSDETPWDTLDVDRIADDTLDAATSGEWDERSVAEVIADAAPTERAHGPISDPPAWTEPHPYDADMGVDRGEDVSG